MAVDIPGSLLSRLDSNLHKFATVWRITRRDGFEIRVTDHNARLRVNNQNYVPVGAFSASAHQKLAGLKERGQEVRGAIATGLITHEDLKSGKYREAKIEEMLVDWEFPNYGPFYTNVYWVLSLRFDTEVWIAEIAGSSSWLRKPVGRNYTRYCRYNLFDYAPEAAFDQPPGCRLVRGDFKVPGSVGSVAVFRSKFTWTAGGFFDDHWFKDGHLEWLTGNNMGIVSEIQGFESDEFDLYLPLNADIQVGDTFDAYPGCDKTLTDCRDKFDNVVNFGGFPFIPGTDRFIFIPDRK